ncbi:centromere protein F isoform X2 [Kryptolebias marmoratus]|uniref:centromere protein F isoform X2 n=1 Tax=Kryptolebias marmoratus TaxID=37003 RepID=UPI0007F9176C|nr:centromere protein F isoform X2 [Kryptolebias marmoratus]
MSWAEEDWTVGLSGRVQQKVKELQVQKERLSRENKQKQLQLDNIHTSLEKQTVKYEEVRGELQCIQRELQSVREEAQAALNSKERLTQEVHTRQAQVCSLEGQLDAAHTLNNKLTQEVKRLEAELEKLQNSSRLADTTLFSTPGWNTAPPWEHSGSKEEERSGQRDEGPSRTHHIRQLQFSEVPTASRQQTKSAPHRHPSDQSDIFSTPLAAFPWERDDPRPASRRRLQPSPQTSTPDAMNQGPLEQRAVEKEKHKQVETDSSSLELQSRVSALEDRLAEKVGTLKSIQNEMVQTKKELAAKELSLQKTCEELSLAQTRMAQDRERASETEHRLKQLQEELKCQRQNAESSRLQHQQRTKELEKQHQRDVAELQKERQCLEKQHQQEVNKLNQELQQARTTHNALQAQADKLSLQKQALDKELDALKEKLKWTEDQLKESQKKEAQTQAKLTEAVREAEGVAVTLEQSRKRERALEEEGRRLKEEQADTLRLLKELQEQKSAPAPPQQLVQFCPVGPSFSSQSSSAQSPRPPTHSRRPAASQSEQKREERVDESRTETTASYPSDREPGEGIDAEHINVITNSECLQRAELLRKSNEEGCKSRDEAIKCDIPDAPFTSSIDGVTDVKLSPLAQSLVLSSESTHLLKSDQTVPSEDVKRENAQLRSELSDVRKELQRRLEDLEAQRRAETEARTRLKQLGRKHASQAAERGEKDKEWKAKLDNEKAEMERLKKANAALEAELRRSREERDKTERTKQEEENTKAQDDRESELIEQNIQLKNQLTMVKAQLALEREERKQEEQERNQIINTDVDVKNELSLKLAEIMADVEDLTHQRNEDLAEEEELANSPLLTLHEDELNSNIVTCDNKLLTSQEEHLAFCESTNQNNTLISKETMIRFDDETGQVDDIKQHYQERSSSSGLQSGELDSSDLVKEVERLRRKNAKESDRANKIQVKFDALQIQVTRQTKELTLAFEKQTQHIAGLLAELQEKESALFSQGEELMRCRQELDVLKKEEKQRDDKFTETSELQPEQEKERDVTFHTADPLADVNVRDDTSQPKTETRDAETSGAGGDSEAVTSEKQQPVSADLKKTETCRESAWEVAEDRCSQNEGTADMLAELIAVRRENQLLKQKIEDLSVSDTENPTLQTENLEESVKQSQSPASLTQLGEQGTKNDILTEEQESLQENVKKGENEGQDSEREERRIMNSENDQQETSEIQVNYWQQQVEALQRKVRVLSEETKAQAQELSVWRLTSQPASTLNHLLPITEDECETLDQISAGSQPQSDQQAIDELPQSQTGSQIQAQEPRRGSQTSQDIITVIREDELSVCCSSNKLRGRMLFSRIQNGNLPEPKSLNSSKKTATSQENRQGKIDQESEKENLEINVQWSDACPEQNKGKKELTQMSSQKMTHFSIAKDPHKVSGTSPTKAVECYTTTPETKQDSFGGNGEPKTNAKTEKKSVSSQTDESLSSCGAVKTCASTQTEEDSEDDEESVDSPPVSVPQETKSGDKMLLSSSFPIPADPARLAERIRRNRTQLSAAFDDTEYEPYGLPEVVMKGFADIPSGPSCPYIVRRGLLGTAAVPMSQKEKEDEETD